MKIKLVFLLVFSFCCTLPELVQAKDGFKIHIKFTDITADTKLYLCNYFGESGGKMYRKDSVVLKAGAGVFKSKEKIVGGIYILIFEDRSKSMEVILLNGDNFSITTKKSDIVAAMKLSGRSENQLFYDYQGFLISYGTEYKKLSDALSTAKTKKDTSLIIDKQIEKSKELTNYRNNFIKEHPKTFLSKLFLALKEPQVPEDWPLSKDGTKDSTFPSRYYKQHYWDDFDLQDDRLMYTPIYETKLKTYLDKWVVPIPDSVKVECDMILQKVDGTKELFKYSLWYLTRWAETNKIMGIDEVFVYLVEEYYMKEKATWLDDKTLKKYIKRATDIAPNIIGQPAKNLLMRNMNNDTVILNDVQAPYTLLVFYAADCGHCRHELPLIDSLYHNGMKEYGVKIVAMEVKNLVKKWKEFVSKNNLNEGWIHTYDPTVTTNYKSFYDAYVNPTIYLLDRDKRIVGKKINHSNILEVIQFLEKKKAKVKTKN